MKKFIVLCVSANFLFSPLTSLAQANLVTAESYLTAHAENPWSTMALSALGASSIPSDYLKSINATTAIEYTAPILAITALGEDPRTFGSKDLVSELKKFHNDDQMGNTATVNDDIFALLALISAGEPVSDAVVRDSKNFILDHQQSNGGWGFATSGGTDSNMTASAIVALYASGVAATSNAIQDGLNYLKTTQNTDGGFTYDPQSPWGTDSDSSSTAWAVWALNALKIDPAEWSKDHTPIEYLESNQTSDGFFQYQNNSGEDSFSPTTTGYAIIALTQKTLPINKILAPVESFTLTYSADVNGSISGSVNQTVSFGATGTEVTASPNIGYHFTGWSDGVITASRTDTQVNADITVTANFVIDNIPSGSSGSSGGLPVPQDTPTPGPITVDPTVIPPPQVLGTITFAEGTLVKTVDSPTVYIIKNLKLRPFSTETAFHAHGLKFSEVQIIAPNIITADDLGKIMGYPDGTLIQGSDSTVYIVLGDTKIGIPSMDVFNRMKLSLEAVVRINDTDLANYDAVTP